MSDFKLHAKWTDDCQGKKNYDGPVISISTRFWPPNYDGKGRYSARSHLMIDHNNEPDDFPDGYSVIEQEFYGLTEDEVKKQVEEFAQKMMDRVVKAVQQEFYVDPNGSSN